MQQYVQKHASDILSNLYGMPTEDQTPIVIDCGVTGTPEKQQPAVVTIDCGSFDPQYAGT